MLYLLFLLTTSCLTEEPSDVQIQDMPDASAEEELANTLEQSPGVAGPDSGPAVDQTTSDEQLIKVLTDWFPDGASKCGSVPESACC